MVALPNYTTARQNMIEGQIRPNRVNDPALLQAFLAIPRERFVPKVSRGIAYIDSALPIGNGRYLVEPMVTARLMLAAALTPSDVVLNVGCGSGYSAAVLSKLAATVVAVDSDPDLVARATETLAELAIDNVVVYQAPLTQGLPAQAPYDAILIDGAVPEVPPAVLEQLGSAEDLYKRPASRFVATFIGKCNLLEGRVTSAGRFETETGQALGFSGDRALGPAALCFRPEQAHLALSAPAGANALPVQLRTATYLGPLTEFDVEAANGQRLLVTAPSASTSVPGEPGTRLQLYWQMADCVLVD